MISCLKWTICNRRQKVCVNFKTDTVNPNIVVYLYRNLKDNEIDLKLTEDQSLLEQRVFLLSYLDIFFRRRIALVETTDHNQKQTPQGMDIFFRLYPGIKLSFEPNSARKNSSLSANFCWDSRLSLLEVDQKHKISGIIRYHESYWDSLFHHFKVSRLHSMLHDAAGAVRPLSGKSLRCC